MKANNTPSTMNANETTYKVTITNESHNYTDTRHNAVLTGFASVEAARKAAKEAARDIAGGLKNAKVSYCETLDVFGVVNPHSGLWLIVAKVEEDSTPTQPTAKSITVKRSEWNETGRRLECSGWYYIGTPTATGKTIYRRGNSEVEIIIEEDSPAPESPELSHAAQCLDIYLNNESEIYNRYTVPAIKDTATAFRHRNGAKYTAAEYWKVLERTVIDTHNIKKALQAAARLVKLYDGLTPTPADVEQVTRNYASYIVDCARYEIENA